MFFIKIFISLFEAYLIDLILNSRSSRGIYCQMTNAVRPSLRSKNSGPYFTALAGVYCIYIKWFNIVLLGPYIYIVIMFPTDYHNYLNHWNCLNSWNCDNKIFKNLNLESTLATFVSNEWRILNDKQKRVILGTFVIHLVMIDRTIVRHMFLIFLIGPWFAVIDKYNSRGGGVSWLRPMWLSYNRTIG